MRGPYGFQMSEHCQTCNLRKTSFFCQLPAKALKDFDSIKSSAAYPEGAILFMEKQESRGVFILCEGEAKLTISSSEGKTLILRIAKPGEILGLMATLSGKPYEVSVETLRPCQIAFVRRDDFRTLRRPAPRGFTSHRQAIKRKLPRGLRAACGPSDFRPPHRASSPSCCWIGLREPRKQNVAAESKCH